MKIPSNDDLIRLEEKIDDVRSKIHDVEIKMVESLSSINASIVKNDDNLQIHMRRSEMLEDSFQLLDLDVKLMKEQVKPILDEVKPILNTFKGLKTSVFIFGALLTAINLSIFFLRFFRP